MLYRQSSQLCVWVTRISIIAISITGLSLLPRTIRAADSADVTLQLLDYDGIQKLVAKHKGKIVVMDVWNLSCPPCLREFPGLVKLHQSTKREDVICISLSLDYAGAKSRPPESFREPVLKFLKSRSATFDNVLATESSDDMLDKLSLGAPPAVYVYGRDGKLVKRFDNEKIDDGGAEFTYKDVSKLVNGLLAK